MWGIYISQIFLIAFNIWMARYHSRLLKRDMKIKHGIWGALYLTLSASITCFFGNLWILIACLLLRKFLFDISLNLYNDRGIFFVSRETTSIIDRIHFKLFGIHSEIYQTAYFMWWVILMIFFAKGY